MTTTNTVLPKTGTPVAIAIGATYAIIENQSSENVLWTTSGATAKAWHKLKPNDSIKVDFATHFKTKSKVESKLCITKD